MIENSGVVIDASFLVKLYAPEEGTERVRLLVGQWSNSSTKRFAPSLIDYEVVSALNKKVARGTMSADEADTALAFALEESLGIVDSDDMHRSALRLAQRLGLRSTYDAHYLAVAEELDCEFWTADERLYNAIRDRFPLIRWIGAA